MSVGSARSRKTPVRNFTSRVVRRPIDHALSRLTRSVAVRMPLANEGAGDDTGPEVARLRSDLELLWSRQDALEAELSRIRDTLSP